MIKALKNKKGMTLTEILVGSIMFALFSIAISTILSPMVLAFMRANDFAEYNALLDAVGNQIASDMVRASEAPVLPAQDDITIQIPGEGAVRYTIDAAEGTLLRNGIPVFPEGFQRGKRVNFIVTLPAAGSYNIFVEITPRDGANRVGLSNAEQFRNYLVRPLSMINDTTTP